MVRIANPVGLAMAAEDALEDGSSRYEPIELQFNGWHLALVRRGEDTVEAILVETATGIVRGACLQINGEIFWGKLHQVRQLVVLAHAEKLEVAIRSTGPE